MPAYDYRCPKCRAKTEVVHPMGATIKVLCPKCRARMARIISDFPHIRFDYKAWYTADEGTRLLLHGGKAGKGSAASEVAGGRI